MEYSLFLLVFLVGINKLKGSSDVKSSLTFVIDDTYSMSDDIAQVKLNADAIFDTVMHSNVSQIEDFVLVTFNDPGVNLRTVTKDRLTFKNALRSIDVHGGDDCPEMAMGGIELALQNSREASFLYVFTDASAKDDEKLARVAALSQKKRSQVVFVLTGDCGDRTSAKYLSFHKLARATQGQVFHMERSEIGKILDYVKNIIQSRKNVITSKTYPAGYGNKFDVNVDGDTKELVISVSGVNPSVGVTDSDGVKMSTEDITRLREVAVVKVRGVKPGVYKVEVGSTSETNVVVSGTTSVHFQHGFSVFEPTAISETATRPVPGEKSHVSIKLNTEGGKVELQSIQILDMDDKVVLETPLRLVDEAEQFYTTDPVVPPNHLFRIAIKGYHRESNTFITRISLTPIQPQDTSKDAVLEKAPVVSIDRGDKIEAKYNEVLQLKCKVSGYPKPDIIWASDDPTEVLSHTESVVELPYEFISFLHIKAVKKSSVYTCKAANKVSVDSKSIAVEMKYFFKALNVPSDTAIEYNKRAQLFCKVDAFPPATVYWYKSHKLLTTDSNVELSADNSTLTIRSMQPDVAGDYICEIRNDFSRNVTPFVVSITGVEKPEINKNVYNIEALKHSSVTITCEIFRGKPAPTFSWFYSEDYSLSKLNKLDETSATLRIGDVGTEHNGKYRCKATNAIGEDSHDIDLIVEYPPSRSLRTSPRVAASEGDVVTLPCPADGAPAPDFTWRHNGVEVPPTKYTILSDGSLRFTASVADSGDYECEARNDHGAIRINVIVDVNEKPEINKSVFHIEALKHSSVNIACDIFRGKPAPTFTWFYSEDYSLSKLNKLDETSATLRIRDVGTEHNGKYRCKATNAIGQDSHDIDLIVEYPPSRNLRTSPRVAANKGEVMTLPCPADGAPAPDFTWRHNGVEVPPTKYTILSDGSLRFRASMADSGDYECEARNDHGAISINVIVDVNEKPKINKNVYYIEALKHSSVEITCEIFRGKPAPTFSWFYSEDYSLSKLNKLEETSATLRIRNVGTEHNGKYRCKATNAIGQDSHDIDLIVEYPPSRSLRTSPRVAASEGDVVTLPCPADGAPAPDFTWRHNGVEVPPTNYTIFSDGSLRFTASVADSGDYECEARNDHGAIRISVTVDVNVPVYIEPPRRSRVSAMVGDPLTLPCRADGFPEPRLAWLYHSQDPDVEPKTFTPSDSSGSLHFERIQSNQDGFYTCIASNAAGSKNITYIVSVLAPPTIAYSAKQFSGVAGDLQLRLPCRAAGNPKPSVTWSKGGFDIPLDSPWYAAEGDGSLLLKNVDARAAGTYVCRATNTLGTVVEPFDAIVLSYPAPGPLSATVWLEEGQSADVACNVPHRKTDRLRWFKDGRIISNEELLLKDVSRHDAGLYTCRVSSFTNTQTGSTQVEVGSKPRFTYNDETNIEFEMGSFAVMSCDATGEPKPEIQWLHDDVPLPDDSSTFEVEMTSSRDKGRYLCIVSNKFGSVQREFEISSYECALDIKKDFGGNEPIMLTRFLDLNQFDTSDGHVHIKKGDTVALVCPSGFNKMSRRIIKVECVNGKEFMYGGERFSYSDLKCREKVNPVVKRTRRRCTDGDSEMMNVGFEIPDRFIEVYQICLDRATKNTIYTKQNITLSLANAMPEYDIKWFNSGSPVDLDRLYDCSNQNSVVSLKLNKAFLTSDACCFARRQLVNPQDVAPGLPQAATYTDLNVVPHWGTCNSQNWEEVEARVRGLARAARRELPVWSGAARALRLPDAAGAPRNVSLSDGYSDYPVPEFLWKVVQDPASDASLAVVQVNVPALRLEDAWRYRLCRDVCSEIHWMRNRRWRSLERGYTYCCSLPEFERALGLRGVFPPRPRLLQGASYLADSSALHL